MVRAQCLSIITSCRNGTFLETLLGELVFLSGMLQKCRSAATVKISASAVIHCKYASNVPFSKLYTLSAYVLVE